MEKPQSHLDCQLGSAATDLRTFETRERGAGTEEIANMSQGLSVRYFHDKCKNR